MKMMEAQYAGSCEFCDSGFAKGTKIIGLGYDASNKSRGYSHISCWEQHPNQQSYRAEDKPENKPLPEAVKAGHEGMYGQTCACGCGQFFHSNVWIVMHPVPDKMCGEWLYWRCSAYRLWDYLDVLLATEAPLALLRTTTDTLQHS